MMRGEKLTVNGERLRNWRLARFALTGGTRSVASAKPAGRKTTIPQLLTVICSLFTFHVLAASYGTLSSGNLVAAPYAVKFDGATRVTATLTEAQANALGYRLVVDERQPCASNEYAVATGWREAKAEGEGERRRIFRVYELRTVAPSPRRWTPLAIKRAAAKLGKWQALKAFLVAADAYDDFCMAQYEAEDDADFVRLMAAARQQLGDAAVDAVLNSAEVEP